ncbi:MAG TPA: hypothetical protein VNZ26_00710, partial [Vicinamibacterales bacterium]|nr:hypothetical protein [Vicinamibacterales bacterium]
MITAGMTRATRSSIEEVPPDRESADAVVTALGCGEGGGISDGAGTAMGGSVLVVRSDLDVGSSVGPDAVGPATVGPDAVGPDAVGV